MLCILTSSFGRFVWSKMWLWLTRKLWSPILPFDLLIKQVHIHLFYIPNPNENIMMMFGSWQLQLVITSYDNHGQVDYWFLWVEGFQTKSREKLTSFKWKKLLLCRNTWWRLLATRTQFHMASKYFFFIFYIVVWFWTLLLISISKILFFFFFQNNVSFSISISMLTFYFTL